MSSILTSFISKKYFLLSLVSFSFCTLSDIYIYIYIYIYFFFNVAQVVAVAVAEAAVFIVQLLRERFTFCNVEL